MKRNVVLLAGILICAIGVPEGFAQTGTPVQTGKISDSLEEDEGPIMFKFEPDYLTAIEKRREEIAKTKSIIDTLDISENKRRKLLRDLYRNGLSKRLSKVLLATTEFEDIEE